MRDLEQALLRFRLHRPELDEREVPAVQTAAHLTKEARPRGRQLDRESRERLNRQRQQEEEEREPEIDRALDDELGRIGRRRRKRQKRDAVELLENGPRENVREDVE